jgi:hypothetical protein
MRVSTKRILSVLASVVFVIGALLVYLNLIQGAMKNVSDKRAVIFSKNNVLNNQKSIVDQVKKLLSQFNNMTKVQETIGFAVPNGSQTINALRQIEAVARANNVSLSSVSFDTSAVKPAKKGTVPSFVKKLGVLAVNIKADGDYENLRGFIQYLETSVRVANVTELKYSTAGAESDKFGTDNLTLVVEMYYQ